MKRMFDIILSIILILIFSPLFLVISFFIKLSSKGPIFYISERIGKDGKIFKLLKFRSMKPNSDKSGSFNVAINDSRVTKIGKILRSTKLDEIPQLFNVLCGEMSFVGPRPDIKFYTEMYTKEENKILSLKPGITDWASLVLAFQYKYFSKATDPDSFFLENIRPQKIKLQLYYLSNHSFIVDLEILFWTFLILVLNIKKLPKKINNLL